MLLFEAIYIINEVHRSLGRIGVCVAPVAAGDKSGAQRKAYRASDALKVVSSRLLRRSK